MTWRQMFVNHRGQIITMHNEPIVHEHTAFDTVRGIHNDMKSGVIAKLEIVYADGTTSTITPKMRG